MSIDDGQREAQIKLATMALQPSRVRPFLIISCLYFWKSRSPKSNILIFPILKAIQQQAFNYSNQTWLSSQNLNVQFTSSQLNSYTAGLLIFSLPITRQDSSRNLTLPFMQLYRYFMLHCFRTFTRARLSVFRSFTLLLFAIESNREISNLGPVYSVMSALSFLEASIFFFIILRDSAGQSLQLFSYVLGICITVSIKEQKYLFAQMTDFSMAKIKKLRANSECFQLLVSSQGLVLFSKSMKILVGSRTQWKFYLKRMVKCSRMESQRIVPLSTAQIQFLILKCQYYFFKYLKSFIVVSADVPYDMQPRQSSQIAFRNESGSLKLLRMMISQTEQLATMLTRRGPLNFRQENLQIERSSRMISFLSLRLLMDYRMRLQSAVVQLRIGRKSPSSARTFRMAYSNSSLKVQAIIATVRIVSFSHIDFNIYIQMLLQSPYSS